MKSEIKFDSIDQITNAYMPVILDKNFSAQEKREFVKKAISQAVHKALEEAAEQIYEVGGTNRKLIERSILSLKEKY